LHALGKQLLLAQWEECGQPKICLKAQDDNELSELRAKAEALNLPTFEVHDAGRTQVAAGSKTILAIGPAARSDIDKVTGHLRLL
jgi:PTH2 family peptidyl-tRNA hydrolase